MSTAPPPRPGSLRDALADSARRRPQAPAAKRWIWLVLVGAVLVLCIGQILGVFPSPAAERMRELHRNDPRKNAPSAPPSPRSETPPAPR